MLAEEGETLRRSLAAYNYDAEKIKTLNPAEMLKYMASRPVIPYRDEIAEALKIKDYNRSAGTLSDGVNCTVCHNKGHILDIDTWGNEVMRECPCMRRREIVRYARTSGLGNLTDKRFKTFEATEEWQESMLSAAVRFAKTFSGREWIILLGQSGSGKTHLCAAIANNLLGAGYEVKYMLWTTAVRDLKRLALDAEYDRLMSRYKNAQVLYIDDLFKGKVTEADIQIAYDLINARYNTGRATILSTELTAADLIRIDGATAGRIIERAGEYRIEIKPDNAKNWRLRDVRQSV